MRVKIQNRSRYEKAFPNALSRGPSLSPRRDAALVVRLWPGAGPASCPVSSQVLPAGSEGHRQCLLSEVLTVSPFLSSAHQGHLLGELTSCIRQLAVVKGILWKLRLLLSRELKLFPVFLLQAVFPVGSQPLSGWMDEHPNSVRKGPWPHRMPGCQANGVCFLPSRGKMPGAGNRHSEGPSDLSSPHWGLANLGLPVLSHVNTSLNKCLS